ncbi:hypothetical protein acdb102_12650 [Acidothermaceae bacterium B102]|nr:hypothetical protein acdb102_12650 [Acidothermaceae bacterium B102]
MPSTQGAGTARDSKEADMRITVVEANVTAAGIADIRPIGVAAPAPVRPSATRRAHAALTRRRSTGPAQHRRPTTVAIQRRVQAPVVAPVAPGDTAVVTVVRPPRHGAGGGPRARPAMTTR